MRYEVTLTFTLDEDVTPGHLAMRVAQACARYNALRPGESVSVDGNTYTVTDIPVPAPDWRT